GHHQLMADVSRTSIEKEFLLEFENLFVEVPGDRQLGGGLGQLSLGSDVGHPRTSSCGQEIRKNKRVSVCQTPFDRQTCIRLFSRFCRAHIHPCQSRQPLPSHSKRRFRNSNPSSRKWSRAICRSKTPSPATSAASRSFAIA